MRVLVTVLLICCAVFSLATPVSADYYWEKDVSADDFTNALVDYCNGNTVHNMNEYEFELSNHDFKAYNVTRTDKSLDFRFRCLGLYCVFFPPIPIPLPVSYHFEGVMHVDNPQDGLKKPYTLSITHHDTKFTADGENWHLKVGDTGDTRFK